MLKRYLKMIENSRVYEVASETPLVEATRLSLRLDNRVWMRREDLQPVYSFKLQRQAPCLNQRGLAGHLVDAGVLDHLQVTFQHGGYSNSSNPDCPDAGQHSFKLTITFAEVY